jgi:hypothetical protein
MEKSNVTKIIAAFLLIIIGIIGFEFYTNKKEEKNALKFIKVSREWGEKELIISIKGTKDTKALENILVEMDGILIKIKDARKGIPEYWEEETDTFINSADAWLKSIKSNDLIDIYDQSIKKNEAYKALSKEQITYIDEHDFDKDDLADK